MTSSFSRSTPPNPVASGATAPAAAGDVPFALPVGKPSWHQRRLSPAAAFPAISLVLFGFFFASSAPSPMFVVMQHAWGFTPSMLTVAFAIYALALLVSLLVAGSLSDFVGRKPVMLASLVLQITAMVAFMEADGIGGLIVARITQGVAMGIATGALAAAVVESAPADKKKLGALITSVSPLTGLALGALLTGFVIEYFRQPIPLVFGALTALFVVGTIVVLFTPETATVRAGALASLKPNVFIPRKARLTFLRGSPMLLAGWALGGLYLGLAPSIMVHLFDVHSGVVNGLTVAVLAGVGALASSLMKRVAPPVAGAVAMVCVAVGMAAFLVAEYTGSVPLFFAGTAVAGIGFGAGFSGFLQGVVPLAQPSERAELFSAIFVVSYLAFSVPAMVAGLLVKPFGLAATVQGYATILIALALVGAVVQWRSRDKAA